MSEKPEKILYEDQEDVWSSAREFIVNDVQGVRAFQEALVWASLAEGQFGLYKNEYRGMAGSDIDLVIIIDENYKIPDTWSFTTVKKSVFDLYHYRKKFIYQGNEHTVDGLFVFPSRHNMQSLRNMLAERSKSVYLRRGVSILDKYQAS